MQRLDWVDDYIARVRPFVFVRPEDRVLIKRPNQAFRMNEAAIVILDRLFNRGEKVEAIVLEQRDREKVISDLDVFFRDLRCMITHGLDENYQSPAVERLPFDYHFSIYPILSELAVTYRCNLKCIFCYAGCNCIRKDGAAEDSELDTEGMKSLIRLIRHDARVPSISFTGGEPLLRSDLPDLIEFACSIGLRTNLITNGTLCDQETATRLTKAGLHSVQISLEGTTPEVHDSVTQVPGAFQLTLRGLEAFRDLGLRVHTNTTLNRLNLHNALEIPEMAKRLRLERFSMNLMMPAGAGLGKRDLLIPYSEIGRHVDAIHRAAQRSRVEFHWYSPTPLCLFNPIARGLGNKGCAACDGLLSIAPNGDVLPCSSYDQPVGNLTRKTFNDVWFGDCAAHFREKRQAPESCRNCEHFAPCQGACPLYWREMGLNELPGELTA